MEETKTIMNQLDIFSNAAREIKAYVSGLENHISNLRKEIENAEADLNRIKDERSRVALEAGNERRESEERLRKSIFESDRIKKEADELMTKAVANEARSKELWAIAERKEAQASDSLSQAQKLKAEYEAKVEKFKLAAQSVG